ncbi:PelD GGDEF domain-containing protein [Vibrio sp. PP-XX7]
MYFHDEQQQCLMILMPLADERDYLGFKQRVEARAKTTLGSTLSQRGVDEHSYYSLPIPKQQLQDVLQIDNVQQLNE